MADVSVPGCHGVWVVRAPRPGSEAQLVQGLQQGQQTAVLGGSPPQTAFPLGEETSVCQGLAPGPPSCWFPNQNHGEMSLHLNLKPEHRLSNEHCHLRQTLGSETACCRRAPGLPEVLLGINFGAHLGPASSVFLTCGPCFSPGELVSDAVALPPGFQ